MSQDELDLLNQFTGARRLSELDRLDERIIILISEDIGGFDLENVIAECDQVSYSVVFHVCSSLQERLHFPLLVVTRV